MMADEKLAWGRMPMEPVQIGDLGTVLVVDRDELWAGTCASHLRSRGYHTVVADSVAEARDKACRAPVTAVIVGNRLPDGDGFGVIEALSRPGAVPGCRPGFVLIVDDLTLDIAMRAIRASVVDVLERPFGLMALDAALGRHRAARGQPDDDAMVTRRFADLTAELRRLSNMLAKDADEEPLRAAPARRTDKDLDAVLVKKLIRAEYSRARVIGGKILGDPAWNILLDLLLASLEGRQVAVSSACIVAGVATTTALRLVNRMVDDGVLVRIPDESDGRRHFLAIEPAVEQALKAYILDLAEL